MACIFQTKAELQLVFSTCNPSSSLYTLDRNQVIFSRQAHNLQTAAAASIRQWLEPSDESQVTAYIINVCILQISVKLQSSDGNQFTTDTSHASYTIFSTPQSACSGQELSYSLHSFTACIQTGAKIQPGPCCNLLHTKVYTYSIIVYLSCCCGCIQSWFASLVYCCAGCYDMTRSFANIYTVS